MGRRKGVSNLIEEEVGVEAEPMVTTKFVPTNLATCYDEERTYYKDLPTGRMFSDKACTREIDEKGKGI